jgi:hypothetical protein
LFILFFFCAVPKKTGQPAACKKRDCPQKKHTPAVSAIRCFHFKGDTPVFNVRLIDLSVSSRLREYYFVVGKDSCMLLRSLISDFRIDRFGRYPPDPAQTACQRIDFIRGGIQYNIDNEKVFLPVGQSHPAHDETFVSVKNTVDFMCRFIIICNNGNDCDSIFHNREATSSFSNKGNIAYFYRMSTEEKTLFDKKITILFCSLFFMEIICFLWKKELH